MNLFTETTSEFSLIFNIEVPGLYILGGKILRKRKTTYKQFIGVIVIAFISTNSFTRNFKKLNYLKSLVRLFKVIT